MSGFKLKHNQDIQGLFQKAEQAAVIDDDNPTNTQNKAPTRKHANNNHNENKKDNENNENNNHIENNEHEHNVRNENNNNNKPAQKRNNDENTDASEQVNNVDNAGDVSSISIDESIVRKVLGVAGSVSALDNESLMFISQLLTKKDYSGDMTDLVYNIVNASDTNINDVRVLNRLLSVTDRVDRVFEILELDFDDLSRVGETVESLTGVSIVGNDKKSRARSLESAIEELSNGSSEMFKKHDSVISSIIIEL